MPLNTLHTKEILDYSAWLDEDILLGWVKCAEFLIQKYGFYNVSFQHKKLSNGDQEVLNIEIKVRDVDTTKVPSSKQGKDITEAAGIALGLLITSWLRPCKQIRVMYEGGGYDYYYTPIDSENEELIEMTGTEKPNHADKRLKEKINKFKKKHPGSSGYISVSSFYDKIQIHWGHKDDT